MREIREAPHKRMRRRQLLHHWKKGGAEKGPYPMPEREYDLELRCSTLERCDVGVRGRGKRRSGREMEEQRE
jgi:hypothetical protein